MRRFFHLMALLCLLGLTGCTSVIKNNQAAFITDMANRHQFDREVLNNWFDQVEIKDDILKKIAKPSEALPWHKYRNIFLTTSRIDEGVQFWQANLATLAATEQQYGVPAAIIVAILGVETRYGQHTGKYRVIDALATLAFAYPPRSAFFRGELEQFLLLCREQDFDPLTLRGSYAGAMGMPQFMPSSFRHYAVDFDQHQRSDIWQSPADAIASIANYLALNHWRQGGAVAVPLTNPKHSNLYKNMLSQDLRPDLKVADLALLDLLSAEPLAADANVKLLAFAGFDGEELWAGLDNFYAITRYNHSPLYALAVYQLSQAIVQKRERFVYQRYQTK